MGADNAKDKKLKRLGTIDTQCRTISMGKEGMGIS
jgi:hypothetical protein